jgi:hypothetical protein
MNSWGRRCCWRRRSKLFIFPLVVVVAFFLDVCMWVRGENLLNPDLRAINAVLCAMRTPRYYCILLLLFEQVHNFSWKTSFELRCKVNRALETK